METVIGYLKRRLNEEGPGAWETIADELSIGKPSKERVSVHLLRKIAYGDRTNPGVAKIQPVLDYFKKHDAPEAEIQTQG
jgi:hypothetical protein